MIDIIQDFLNAHLVLLYALQVIIFFVCFYGLIKFADWLERHYEMEDEE